MKKVVVVSTNLKGHVFCGGVSFPNDIPGNPKLQEAYDMGKQV